MKIQHILEECKKALKEEYGNKLKDIILYGSWARGTATEDSDIDLLIISTDRHNGTDDDSATLISACNSASDFAIAITELGTYLLLTA